MLKNKIKKNILKINCQNNKSRNKKILTVLDPTVGSPWLIISIFDYLWLRNREKKVKTKQASKQKC
jgi:hypothetical protein